MGSTGKLITVFGATGKQGGSVCRSLIQNTGFDVRAITRSPNSEASKSLSDLGVEIVKGDGWNAEDMVRAFDGSWGAFINTNSFDPIFLARDGTSEFELGKIIVDSASKAGVQHLVYSTGAPCKQMTGGKIELDSYDKKFEVEEYIRANEKFNTFTAIGAGWFLENFLEKEQAHAFAGFPYHPDSEGYFTYKMPQLGKQKLAPWVDIANDFGDMVHGIFLQPERWNSHTVHGISELLSYEDVVCGFEQVTGKKSRYEPILPSWEAFETWGIPELEVLKLFFGFAYHTDGRIFGPEENECVTAAELKRVTGKALGRPDASLSTVASWFKENFAL